MNEKLKRLLFIKKHAPKKFKEALLSGKLVPSAYEMNIIYGKKSKYKKRRYRPQTFITKFGGKM